MSSRSLRHAPCYIGASLWAFALISQLFDGWSSRGLRELQARRVNFLKMDPRGLGSSPNILIWLSPLCRPGVGGVVLVGRKPVEELAVDRVDDALEPVHVRSRALAEIGSLRVPPADEAVAVLDGPLFPGGLGARAVDVAPDGGLYPLGVEELAAVVGRDGARLAERLAPDRSLQGLDDPVLRDVFQLLDDVAPALAVDEDEQSAGPVRDETTVSIS